MALGNGLNVLKVMPESAIKFGAYEVFIPSLSHTIAHDHGRRQKKP